MKKTALAIVFAGLSVSSAMAQEFTVKVNFEARDTPLEIQQSTELSFPALVADNATKNGASCEVAGAANTGTNETSLCPGETGTLGIFKIIGAANAVVTVTQTADDLDSGLRLTNMSGQPETQPLTLDPSGEGEFYAAAKITLEDKAAASTSEYTFQYDISVAYQ